MIISFVNQKGGVGKTTSTQAVATALAEKGEKVLVIDLDPQGNLGVLEGIPLHKLENTLSDLILGDCDFSEVVIETNGFHLIPSMIYLAGTSQTIEKTYMREFAVKRKVEPYYDDYDHILLDCPPNLAILTINALAMSDYICLVSESEFLSKIALENLEQTIQQIQREVNSSLKIFGVIITKIDSITNHSKEIVEDIEEMYKDFKTFKVAHSVKVKDSPKDHMTSIVKVFPDHKASKAYVEVAEAIINDK